MNPSVIIARKLFNNLCNTVFFGNIEQYEHKSEFVEYGGRDASFESYRFCLVYV